MINIGIADDHAVVRAGLGELPAECVDMRVGSEAVTSCEAIDLFSRAGLDMSGYFNKENEGHAVMRCHPAHGCPAERHLAARA